MMLNQANILSYNNIIICETPILDIINIKYGDIVIDCNEYSQNDFYKIENKTLPIFNIIKIFYICGFIDKTDITVTCLLKQFDCNSCSELLDKTKIIELAYTICNYLKIDLMTLYSRLITGCIESHLNIISYNNNKFILFNGKLNQDEQNEDLIDNYSEFVNKCGIKINKIPIIKSKDDTYDLDEEYKNVIDENNEYYEDDSGDDSECDEL